MKYKYVKTIHKKSPSYWWDFDTDLNIIIESDIPDKSILAKFFVTEDAESQIKMAEFIIKELTEGRISL
jgi:hypothetical protein